ncbi:unnamed protein product [Ixodes persulcatus]
MKGYAYAGGACRETRVGMVEDQANMFIGTHTFVHEVGHFYMNNFLSHLGCPTTVKQHHII